MSLTESGSMSSTSKNVPRNTLRKRPPNHATNGGVNPLYAGARSRPESNVPASFFSRDLPTRSLTLYYTGSRSQKSMTSCLAAASGFPGHSV
jgi:hypothetical protein